MKATSQKHVSHCCGIVWSIWKWTQRMNNIQVCAKEIVEKAENICYSSKVLMLLAVIKRDKRC